MSLGESAHNSRKPHVQLTNEHLPKNERVIKILTSNNNSNEK